MRKVCGQVEKFVVSAPNLSLTLVDDFWKVKSSAGVDQAREWSIGGCGITVDQLVLVSLIRVSVGCWVPCIRLAAHESIYTNSRLP